MKNLLLLLALTSALSYGQNKKYSELIKKADSLYNAKEYKQSGLTYSAAFKTKARTNINDHYNAACSWALANVADSSFVNLYHAVNKDDYTDYEHISTDSDLNSLHNDKRWTELLALVKTNQEKEEAKLNKPLMAELEIIIKDDQKLRKQMPEVEKQFGKKSPEVEALWKQIEETDVANLAKITNILDKYGWVGPDVVGAIGNQALFLVIQHSDIKTQEKYLPMMRDAVKKGNARAESRALLEDRVALRQGKRQIYGSQIGDNPETGNSYVLPLEDAENVDKRRASVGLGPLAAYVSRWKIIWDAKQYAKDLPAIEAMEKTRKK
ncbi:MAG TPA: DUF6624 domain-containing protein [Flavobacterium sp.]|nr:DUF6624 domain-containing protein [Flavobacterium sp.]